MGKDRRHRIGGFIDRHATMLTILAMAALVLIPTKIAYDASGHATKAGNTATKAATKAKRAVVRLEAERRQRIFDQNGIDRYFCGKSGAIEKVLTLLVTAALSSHKPDELSEAQLDAREVFEGVLAELAEAPKCEVLIPKPPKPKAGESKAQGAAKESQAQDHPSETPALEATEGEPPPPPSGTTGGSTESSHHHRGPGTGTKESSGGSHHSSGGDEPAPSEGSEEVKPPTAAPPPTTTTEAPASTETKAPEEAAKPEESTPKPLVPSVVESVEHVVECVGKLDVACTLHEVVGGG